MSDIVLEVIGAAILLYVVLYLVKVGKKRKELCRKGWGFVVAGFGLLLFGNILDITDNFESLGRFIVIGDTHTEAFLEKMVGFLGGFLLLTIGLIRWIPTITGVHRTKQLNEELEKEITDRKQAEDALRASEEKATTLFESLPQLVWTCRVDGPCDYLSPQWVKYTGIPEAKQLGYGWLDQLHPDDREPTTEVWNNVVKSGCDFHVEFRIRRHDGTYRWFYTHALLLHDLDGRPTKWYGSNTDITERKQAEEILRSSEHQMNAMFNASPVGMMLVNEHTEVIRVNVYLTDKIGKNSEELLGLQPGEVLDCANAHNDKGGCGKGEACVACPTRGAVTQVLETGQPIYNAEVNMTLLADGQIRNTWLSFSLVQIEIDEHRHVMTAFVDITKSKQAEEEKGHIIAELERMNQLMTGRELRVIEMKKEVNSLLTELGKEAKYYSVLEEQENKV